MKIKIQRNSFFFKARCFFCGGGFDLGEVIAKVYLNEDHWHDVCLDCLKAGHFGMKKILIRCVEELREKAKTIAGEVREQAKVTEDLASQEIECPTWNEFQKEKRKILEEIKRDRWIAS